MEGHAGLVDLLPGCQGADRANPMAGVVRNTYRERLTQEWVSSPTPPIDILTK